MNMNPHKKILFIALGVMAVITVGVLLIMPKQPFSPYEADVSNVGLNTGGATTLLGSPATLNFSVTNRTFFPLHVHLINNVTNSKDSWRQNNTWVEASSNCSIVSQTEFDCGTVLPGKTENLKLTGNPKTIGIFNYSFSLVNQLRPSDPDDAMGGVIYGAKNQPLTIEYTQETKILILR